MKSKLWILSLSLGIFIGAQAHAKIQVVTTLPSFADIASQIGGDEVAVKSLTRGTQDPHFVDAKPDLILYLHRADLLIHAGLGLEDGWLPPLQTGSRNDKIQTGSDGNLNVSTLIPLKEVPKGPLDRAQGDVHPGGNPHFMLDPHNGVLLAEALAARFAKMDPSKADDFERRAAIFKREIAERAPKWKKELAWLQGQPIVTYHKSWVYFIDWIGLNEIGTVEPKPGIPPSPEHLVTLINLMRQKNAHLIIMEPFYPKGAAEHVAETTHAKLVVLPAEVFGTPEAKTYFALFDNIVERLKAALGPK
ncbi:MAG: metal ABC transporter substrate-binding protein [Bdellovibrionota bacterium]